MNDNLITSVVTVATAIVGVALIAVLVSRNANTAQVISSAGGAFSNALGAAVAPVKGSSFGGGNFTGMSGGYLY